MLITPLNRIRGIEKTATSRKETVCIVGGGFGGLYTALQIRKKLKAEDDVYLIDKKDSFVFLPLLYELCMGSAVDTEVAPKYSSLLANKNIKFIKGEAVSVDFENKTLLLKSYHSDTQESMESLTFDQIVLAVGIQPRTDLIMGAKEHCIPFYRLEDAYELKEKLATVQARNGEGVINVAIIGGGYSGVEVATTIAHTIGKDKASLTIFDRNMQIMGTSTTHNRNTSLRMLKRYGIATRLRTSVKEVRESELLLSDANGEEYSMPADLIILTSGTEQTNFIKSLDIIKDAYGRILTSPTLQSKDYPDVFALGDCSSVDFQDNPCTAQVAMQQSGLVAKNVKIMSEVEPVSRGDAALSDKLGKFKFLNLGEMLTLGLTDASVTSLGGWLQLSGPLASIGRRLVYIVRQPTKTQTVKSLVAASIVTTSKVVRSIFSR